MYIKLKNTYWQKMLIIEPSASHSINSKITSNNNEKVCIILRVTKMWHTDSKIVNAIGKMTLNRLAWQRIATNIHWLKKNAVSVKRSKAKHNNTKSAYMSSLEKMSIHVLCPVLDGLFVFYFAVELYDLCINLSDT